MIALIVREEIVEGAEGLTAEADLFSCGLDSLAMMQLMLHVERVFGVVIPPGEMRRERFATAAALALWLGQQQRQPQGARAS